VKKSLDKLQKADKSQPHNWICKKSGLSVVSSAYVISLS